MASASTEYPMNIAMGSTAAASNSSMPAAVPAQSSCAGPADADWDTLSTNASESEPEVEEEEVAEISDGEEESTLPKSVAASLPPSLPLLTESSVAAVEAETKNEKPASPTTSSTATSISVSTTPTTTACVPATQPQQQQQQQQQQQPKPQQQADLKKPRWADVLDTDSEDEGETARLGDKAEEQQKQQQQVAAAATPAFEMPAHMDSHLSSSSSLRMGAVQYAEGALCHEQWDLAQHYPEQWVAAAQTQDQEQSWMAQTGGDSWCGHGPESASWEPSYCGSGDYDASSSWNNGYRTSKGGGAKKGGGGKRAANSSSSNSNNNGGSAAAGWYPQASWGNSAANSSHATSKGKSWKSSQKEQQWDDWTQTTGNASADNNWPRGMHCNWGNGTNYGYGYDETCASATDAAAAGTGGYTGWSKPQCQFFIGIEEEPKFKVTRKILGPHGRHMKDIAQATNAKLRLRGRGSGFKEGQYNMESTDDLMLCVSAPDVGSYQEAVRMVTELLEDIYEQYRSFCRRSGESVPELAINLHEGPRPGSR